MSRTIQTLSSDTKFIYLSYIFDYIYDPYLSLPPSSKSTKKTMDLLFDDPVILRCHVKSANRRHSTQYIMGFQKKQYLQNSPGGGGLDHLRAHGLLDPLVLIDSHTHTHTHNTLYLYHTSVYCTLCEYKYACNM